MLAFKNNDGVVRLVHPDSTGTQKLLKRAGFVQVVEGEEEEEAGETRALPSNSWIWKKLTAAGFDSPDAVKAADDAALLAVEGIGPKTLQVIRDSL